MCRQPAVACAIARRHYGGSADVDTRSWASDSGSSPSGTYPPATVGGDGAQTLGKASLCTPSTFTLCDGFETATSAPDAALWQVLTQSPMDTVSLDTTRAARGRNSLHFHTANTGYERAMVTTTKIFPAQNNTFYGRAFVWIAGPMPQAHFTLFTAEGLLPGKTTATQLRYGGQFGIYIANYIGDDEYQHAAVWKDGAWTDAAQVPTDRWVCMEWLYKGDSNEMDLWQDGVEISKVHIIGESTDDCCKGKVWQAPPYDTMALGWEVYTNIDSEISAYDIWMDEVAMNTTRIGCDR